MKKLLGLIFLLLQMHVFANMANPVTEGTLGARPFVSEFVDVTHEDLFIEVDENFEYARFKAMYHINSSTDGFQIPFLFYASEFLDSFIVKLDGVEVQIQEVSYEFDVPENTKFKDFAYFFERSSDNDYSSVLLEETPDAGFYVNLHNMIYFESDIPAGEHVIEVSYRATNWTDAWDWVKEYSFRYALSPAKYWKSFGTLHVTVDASQFDQELLLNLGPPTSGDLNSTASWQFDSLPVEILQIIYIPEISSTTQTLINISPKGLAYLTAGVLVIIHCLLILWYRKRNPDKRFSLVVIIGSLLIPLIFLVSWVYYFELIHGLVGEHAGKKYGYNILAIGLYPFITPVYWGLCWLLDKLIKRKLTQD